MSTDRKCKKCGSTDLYSDGRCKPCYKVSNAAYRAANPEKIAAMKRSYSAANAEKERARAAAWSAANKERKLATGSAYRAAHKQEAKAYKAGWAKANSKHVVAKVSEWRKANPGAHRAHGQNRRARKTEAGGILTKGLAAKLFALQRGMCACCKLPLGENYHMDHIMPLALGGTNTDDNMQLLRQRCNNQKSAKHPVDFMQERGLLL